MGNLVRVIGSPAAAFRNMQERGGAGWLLALLVLMAVTLAAVFIQWPLLEQAMMDQLAQQEMQLTESQMELTMNFSKITSFVTAGIMPVIWMFLGGLLLLLLKLIVRGEGTYLQLSKVMLYSQVPGTIGGILTTLLLIAFGAESAQDVALNGGALFAEKSGFAYTIASSLLDPFGWWGLAVMSIGASVMMNKPVRKVAVWIVAAWLVFSILFALPALAV